MSFSDYIEFNMKCGLTKYRDQVFSGFYPFCGLVEMDVEKEEYLKAHQILTEPMFYIKRQSNEPLWFLSYLHELLHCYQIMGSSLGSLDIITSRFQDLYIGEIKRLRKKKPDYNFYSLYEKQKTTDHEKESVDRWKTFFDIRCLFDGECGYYLRSNDFVPRIKNFIESIENCCDIFFHFLDQGDVPPGIEANGNDVSLIEDLQTNYDRPVDLKIKFTGDLHNKKLVEIFQNNYFYCRAEDALLLPTRAIAEGYAAHTESILFGRLVHDMHENKINPTIENDFYKKIGEIDKERYGGIYSVVREMLYDKLGWIQEQRGWFEFFDTCSAIFEIALMTRFHPVLLYCDGNPRLDEVLIPIRFQKALNFFSSNHLSISDFCEPKVNLLDGLDKICVKLDFLKFSQCLDLLWQYHSYQEAYPDALISKIVEQKLKGHCFYDISELNDSPIPVLTIFKDDNYLDVSKLDLHSHSIDEYSIFINSLDALITDEFGRELILKNNFKNTKALIKKHYITNLDKRSIKDFLMMNGLDKFLDIDELYN